MTEQTKQIDITQLELWQLWKMIAEQQGILFQTQTNINMLQTEIQRREQTGAGNTPTSDTTNNSQDMPRSD